MKVLFAIDLFYETNHIVSEVKKVAKALSADVWLLHVALPDPDFVGYGTGPQSERDFMAEEFHREHRQIQEIAQAFRDEGLSATALLVQGFAVDVILSEASKLSVDMIVIGSHCRGVVSQVMIGSVSRKVLRKASCPVLVIPNREPD